MHFNIQIMVQKVEEITPVPVTRHHNSSASYGADAKAPRDKRVTELLNLKVTAQSEQAAYAKAATMLEAATPALEPHVHRASCDDASGNHVCGFA